MLDLSFPSHAMRPPIFLMCLRKQVALEGAEVVQEVMESVAGESLPLSINMQV